MKRRNSANCSPSVGHMPPRAPAAWRAARDSENSALNMHQIHSTNSTDDIANQSD